MKFIAKRYSTILHHIHIISYDKFYYVKISSYQNIFLTSNFFTLIFTSELILL